MYLQEYPKEGIKVLPIIKIERGTPFCMNYIHTKELCLHANEVQSPPHIIIYIIADYVVLVNNDVGCVYSELQYALFFVA